MGRCEDVPSTAVKLRGGKSPLNISSQSVEKKGAQLLLYHKFCTNESNWRLGEEIFPLCVFFIIVGLLIEQMCCYCPERVIICN